MRRLPLRKARPSFRPTPRLAALEGRVLLSADVLTYHNDNARTGLDHNETVLTPTNVNSTDFGKLFVDSVDGKVDAQPLYQANVTIPGQGMHNILYVATEHDSLYAFDADTGALYWKVSLLGNGETPSDARGSDQVVPEIGITSTPVINPNTGTVYAVAMSKLVSGNATTYFQRLHALDIATGLDKVMPKTIDSSIQFPGKGPGGNGTDVIFDPKQYKERDALLLLNNVVYTSWSSHSDIAPYTGWIIGFHANDLSVASVLNIDPNGTPVSSFLNDGSGNSFWNSGDGPSADASGNIYNLSANGPFDPTQGDYGDSFLKFSTANGLAVADYFAPSNQQSDANGDTDIGSSGQLLADVTDGNGVTHHLMIGSGKDGNIYVVNRDNLGHFSSSGNNIYQEIPGGVGGGEFAAPAYFNGQVYFGGVGATLRAYQFNGSGLLGASPASQTSNKFGYPGTTPSISSNGTADGIVWAAENGSTAVLHAYDASNLSHELYNSNQAANSRDHFGTGNKFIAPMIANGKVYVATTNGVGVFGLLSPTVATHASASPSPATGTTTSLSVLGADPINPESSLTYTWTTTVSPSGAPAPTFSANGTNAAKSTTATFGAAGAYTFQVTIANPSHLTATDTVNVTVDQTLSRVSVSPPSTTLADGGTQQFAATAFDQFGTPLASPPTFSWSVDPGGVAGTVNSSGKYTAPASGSGTDTVRATAGSVSGAATANVTAGPLFSAHINFTADPATVPAGYVDDVGQTYGARGNGLIFGWNSDNAANARDRDSSTSPNELQDTFVHMQKPSDPNASWKIAVPNGTYSVHLIAGDPNFIDSVFKINVNGVLALNGTPTSANHWVANSVTVTVTNGFLTVSNAAGSKNNKIDAIDIAQTASVASSIRSTTAAHPLGTHRVPIRVTAGFRRLLVRRP